MLDRLGTIQQEMIRTRAAREEKQLLRALVARITRDTERDLIARQMVAGKTTSV